eukprot:225858-Rhodomonas_salina.3
MLPGNIAVGDLLLKVDGRAVKTASGAILHFSLYLRALYVPGPDIACAQRQSAIWLATRVLTPTDHTFRVRFPNWSSDLIA